MVALIGSHQLLLVAIGSSACLAALHLWLARGGPGASRWVGVWALLAMVFAGARLVQLDTQEPAVAIAAARVTAATSQLLIWSLCRLVGSVVGRPTRRTELGAVAAFCFLCAALALATPWFIRAETDVSFDLFGRPYLGVPGGPLMPLVGAQIALALGWSYRELHFSTDLEPRERRLLFSTLSIYAAMGASTLASSLGWSPVAGAAEYGPLIVSVGASQLVAMRQRRLEQGLQQLVAQRTAALRDSEERYHQVVEAAPIGILSLDANGQLLHTNARLLAMLGSTREQFASSFNVLQEENSQRSGFSAMLRRALLTGEVHSAEFEFASWWGRKLITRTMVAPRRDAQGRIVGALALVDDVSERRAIERQLQQAQKMEAVGQLAAGIAHEINNPMAYVRANLSALREDVGALRKEVARAAAAPSALARLGELDSLVGDCLEGVQRTVAIVSDVREFSRSGRAEREATDVNALIQNVARLAATDRAGSAQVSEQLGPIPPVLGAPGELRQVFLNLLVHALKAAGPAGAVVVSTQHAEGEVRVRVHDDGPPIPVEYRARLFEPFLAARATGAAPSLGLYVSHQIVKSHGGDLRAEFPQEGGTTFEVRLPAAPQAAE